MKLHILKIRQNYFEDILVGVKTFELRKNDRDYKVGDLIHFVDIHGEEYPLRCFDNNHITTPIDLVFQITYVLKDVTEFGLDKDYCILGIKQLEVKEWLEL